MRYLKVDDFDIRTTLECGQTFSWNRKEEGYINTDVGQVVYVEQRGNRLYYESSSGKVDLRELLRLNDPIDEIKQELAKDEFITQSIEHSHGLRIISDPFYPCLISFLISTWSNIPRIKKHMRDIRETYGPKYEFRGKTYYGMPSPETMSDVSAENLRDLGLAWRADFISQSTEALMNGDVKEEELRTLGYEEAHRELQSLYGVGAKVADCICLFSLGFLEAFPIDVWIERVIQQHYGLFTTLGKSYAKKSRAARQYFGRYAGYAQEYLYHYTRTF